MPAHLDAMCRSYVDSLPSGKLTPKRLERELREVRSFVAHILSSRDVNPGKGLLDLTHWTTAKEDALIAACPSDEREAAPYNVALNAVTNLNALVAAELTDVLVPGSKFVSVETMGVTLSVAEERMVSALGLPKDQAARLRIKMESIKSGKWDGLRIRSVVHQPQVRAVAFGKIRVLFNHQTGEIVSVGYRKDVYDYAGGRN